MGVLEGSGGYSGVLWGTVFTVGALHGTAGYCWLLLGKGWYWGYWVVLGIKKRVLWGTAGYCWALLNTAGFCQVLHGTTGYSGGVLGAYCGKERYFGILQGTLGTGATWGC